MKLPLTELIAHFDAKAAAAAEWSESLFDDWHRTAAQTVIDRAEVDDSDVVLELGCGTGRIAKVLAPHVRRFVALDCSPNMLALARSNHEGLENAEWVLGDLREPPAIMGLSTVLMCHSLRYLDPVERKALFALLQKRLPKDGLLVIGGLLWSLRPDEVDGIDGWLDERVDHAPMATDVEEELQALGYHTRMERLHPGVAVIRALRP